MLFCKLEQPASFFYSLPRSENLLYLSLKTMTNSWINLGFVYVCVWACVCVRVWGSKNKAKSQSFSVHRWQICVTEFLQFKRFTSHDPTGGKSFLNFLL